MSNVPEEAKRPDAGALEKELLEKQIELEKLKRENLKRERSAEVRSEVKKGFLRLPKKVRRVLLVSLLLFIALAALVVYMKTWDSIDPATKVESQLEKVVEVEELSTAKFVYNGIASKHFKSGREWRLYNVKYEATVKAGVNMEDIEFEVDREARTVTPVLPDIRICDPVIDTSTLNYLPNNPDVKLKTVISLCKKDVIKEVSEDAWIK